LKIDCNTNFIVSLLLKEEWIKWVNLYSTKNLWHFWKDGKVIGIKIVNFDELFDVIVKIVTKQLDEVEKNKLL
jgi:hypothetical protein